MTIVKHYHHHYHFSYYTSLRRHFISTLAAIIIITLGLFLLLKGIYPVQGVPANELSITLLLQASLFTFIRLFAAYLIALIVSVPLALLVTYNAKTERLLLPFFDVLQSIPVLAFFPVIVLAFLQFNFYEGAAIFVLFLVMVWNITFTMVGGLKSIPDEIKLASLAYHARGLKKLTNVTLPSILPYIITGSLLAWGQGWNIIIVAEVLHNYIPQQSNSSDLFGLGSLLVNAIAAGETTVFLSALAIMIILIGLMNFFVWQKLLHLTERFKYG